MMTQQALDKLYDMKLTAMAEAFSQQITQPDLGDLSFEDRFAMLADPTGATIVPGNCHCKSRRILSETDEQIVKDQSVDHR